MDEPEKPRSRRALAGDSLLTDTAAGDSEQSPPEPPEDEAQPDEEQPVQPAEQIGVLDPRRGGGQPQGPYDHWLYHEDWL